MSDKPHSRRTQMLRAMFARMREKQVLLRGAQRSIKASQHALGAWQDIGAGIGKPPGRKVELAKAYMTLGSTVLGIPSQIIKAGASAQKAANEARVLQAMSENIKKGAILQQRGLPFPGKGMRGRWGKSDLIPPKHYVRYRAPRVAGFESLKKYDGWYFDPASDIYQKIVKASPGPGRPAGTIKIPRKSLKKIAKAVTKVAAPTPVPMGSPLKPRKRLLELD